jgi:hypothetical protein
MRKNDKLPTNFSRILEAAAECGEEKWNKFRRNARKQPNHHEIGISIGVIPTETVCLVGI